VYAGFFLFLNPIVQLDAPEELGKQNDRIHGCLNFRAKNSSTEASLDVPGSFLKRIK